VGEEGVFLEESDEDSEKELKEEEEGLVDSDALK
jgi:hypothetical protein